MLIFKSIKKRLFQKFVITRMYAFLNMFRNAFVFAANKSRMHALKKWIIGTKVRKMRAILFKII